MAKQLDNTVSAHFDAGHKIVVWWDIPYKHRVATELNKDGKLVVYSSSGRVGFVSEGKIYACEDCDTVGLALDALEVSYV